MYLTGYGRWDTNTHPIADAHPGNVDAIIFPGQDFNNARIYDFSDVDKWEQNKRKSWSFRTECENSQIHMLMSK